MVSKSSAHGRAAPAVTADTFAHLAAAIIAEKQLANAEGRPFEVYDDRISALETESSFHTAETPVGALYQLGVAKSDLQTLAANEIDEETHAGELYRNVERLIVQVTRYVENTSGVTRESAGLSYYGEPKHDAVAFGAPLPAMRA